MVDDEKEDKRVKVPKPKMVAVTTVLSGDAASLVEYFNSKKGTMRVTIPTALIVDGQVPQDELEAGVPYGIPWEKLTIKPITPEALARALRDERIFTQADLDARRTDAFVAILRLSGLLMQDLLQQVPTLLEVKNG